MCDISIATPVEPLVKPKYRFKISTIHRSVEFLEAIVDTFFVDPFSNCSKETLIAWHEYREIQHKAFMEYLERIFTKEFLELYNDKFYYSITELKVRNNYNSYLKFFNNLRFFEKNIN